MQNLGNLTAAQVLNSLRSMSFPLSKMDILNKAREMGASPEQQALLDKIPDRQYGSPHEVMAEIKHFVSPG